MIQDKEKISVCKTLDFCWLLNLNAQMKCQEIFKTLNGVWNNFYFESVGSEMSGDDSVKFRKLMQSILGNEIIDAFSNQQCIIDLSNLDPLIHNDAVISAFQGRPYNPNKDDDLPIDIKQKATEEHLEFRKYLERIQDNPNSDNRRNFRNKLCRLLYVVRSNIAHGSKSNYEGSQRNEEICKIIYSVLIQICNLILDNGLYKVSAYGELKQNGTLFEPLVINNKGKFVCSANISGQLNYSSNTLLFNPDGEYETVDVEILEFETFEALQTIDLVECMPRVFKPYYHSKDLKGFAWVYCSFLNVQNSIDPIASHERQAEIADKAQVFLYALLLIRSKFQKPSYNGLERVQKMFGGLTIKFGKTISLNNLGDESQLIMPHACDLINMIDEVNSKYSAIFDHFQDIFPYSKKIYRGVEAVHFERPHLFKSYPEGTNSSEAEFIFKDMVDMIIELIASWMCEQINDIDSETWEDTQRIIN